MRKSLLAVLLAQSASAKSAVTTTVDVPKDADSGVTVTQGGTSTRITLPGAKNADPAVQVAPGVTAYSIGKSNAQAVIAFSQSIKAKR